MNNDRINLLKKEKMSKFYPVKGQTYSSVKNVDLNRRTVQFIGNTYYYVDSDRDILIDGSAIKTISDRGPQSNASAKIKHLADHKMSVNEMVGKPTLIEETKMDGRTVIYCESEIFETQEGDDHLIKYQSGGYDQHSIGFRYVDIEYAEKESENSDAKAYWNEYYPQLLNPEEADKYNYFWVVKEIELYEISVVTFGANSLTGVVGIKSKNKEDYLFELWSRTAALQEEIKTGRKGKDHLRSIDLQIKQINQVISDVVLKEPSLKPHLKEPQKIDTPKAIDYNYLISNIN